MNRIPGERTDAREAEGSGLLSRPASDGRAGSNPAPSAFNPPYHLVYSAHGPVTIYDSVDVGWIARVKESLPHKEALAVAMVAGLNDASEAEHLREALRRCGELARSRKTGAIQHLVKTTLGVEHFSPQHGPRISTSSAVGSLPDIQRRQGEGHAPHSEDDR